MSQIQESVSGSTGEIDCPAQGKRVIKVKVLQKKRSAHEVGGGGGLSAFDSYLAKSGLEPKQYQRDGLSFCLQREEIPAASTSTLCSSSSSRNILGGIIADEMGLGKTIIMIGLILANLVSVHRTLIVVPVALISQWVAQLKKTVIDSGVKPDLTIAVFHGAARQRIVLSRDDAGGGDWHLMPSRKKKNEERKRIDIVITTYGSVALEVPSKQPAKVAKVAKVAKIAKATRLSLLSFRAERVIFDEAHHMRNKKGRLFQGAMKLLGRELDSEPNMQSPQQRVWIVTGTPIQNKITDLKSLCYILGFKPADVIRDEQRTFIRDNFVLRRTKLSVGMLSDLGSAGESSGSCLQPLEHSSSNVDWNDENELRLSQEIHTRARFTQDRTERLKLYTRMRQMCVWPALMTGGIGATKKTKVANDAVVDHTLPAIPDEYNVSKDVYQKALSRQSKLDKVVEMLLREISADGARKSIVFCHFRNEMNRIRDMLMRGGSACAADVEIIDGSVSSVRRNRILASLPQILILQIRTCSEGLNLQAYSNVYFVSPHWNPCVEDQAIARCYRMGQLARVRVFRFYMTDFVCDDDTHAAGSGGGGVSTLDHKCEEIQERKRVLCREFLDL
jgi:SNF2 family DNA or RNA helicase